MLRYLVLTVSIFATFAAGAVEAADDLSTDITSLNYFPHKGHAYLLAQNLFPVDEHWRANDGSNGSLEEGRLTLSSAFGFGDGFRAGGRESLTFSQKTYSDLALFAEWRFWAPQDSDWCADIGGTISTPLGRKKTAKDGESGNDLSGYASAQIAGRVFRHFFSQDAGIAFHLNQRFSGSTDAGGSDFPYTSDAMAGAGLSLTDRYHFNADWFFDAALDGIGETKSRVTYADGSSETRTVPFHAQERVTLGWRVQPVSMISAQFAYSHFTYERDSIPRLKYDSVMLTAEAAFVHEF